MPAHHRLSIACVACLIAAACLVAPASALTRDVPWHATLEAAQLHSSTSGKPILAFVYQGGDKGCDATIQYLLPHELVIAQLRTYELLAVNTHNPAMRAFCVRYGVGVDDAPAPFSDDHSTVHAVLPVYLILDSQGREMCRDYGQPAFYSVDRITGDLQIRENLVPKSAFGLATRLEQMGELARLQTQLQNQPSATAHAQAGQLLMKLERHDRARYHLQMAMQMDPENTTGAFADAYLDNLVLDIAEDPKRCLQQLQDYERRYTESRRLLEVRYYQAVCHIALEDYKSAGRVLQTFETEDKTAPEFDSPWTPGALGLLKQLRALKLY